MRLKIPENLRTASLNPKFTVLIKKCIRKAPGFTVRATTILLNEWVRALKSRYVGR